LNGEKTNENTSLYVKRNFFEKLDIFITHLPAGFMTQEWKKKLEAVYSKKMKLGTLTFQQNWPHLNWSYKTPYIG